MTHPELPLGFRFVGLHAGIKRKRPDLGLVVFDVDAVMAGTFTTNIVRAAPVGITRKVVERGTARALVVNSGNANACTGPEGEADALEMQRLTASAVGCDAESVAVASTGVIGVPLPMDALKSGIPRAAYAVGAMAPATDPSSTSSFGEPTAIAAPGTNEADGLTDFAESIRTTDTFAKIATATMDLGGTTVRLAGVAKGSGMIHPNMATMLAFVFTDAAVDAECWKAAWRETVAVTFNQVSVDGDTSTNDMALAFANGMAGNEPISSGSREAERLSAALLAIATDLSEMIARDGEGATKLIRVEVTGSACDEDARKVARSVASSALVKTAVHGADPNWGRVLCAAGYSGVDFDPSQVTLTIGAHRMLVDGRPIPFDEDAASETLRQSDVEIHLNLNGGAGCGRAWGCDLTAEYVRINGEYRT